VRSLSPEEKELWQLVASTIRPLSRDQPAPLPVAEKPREILVKPRGRIPAPKQPPAVPARRDSIAGRTLDGSWDKRLGAGDVAPDAVLDLHGMNLDTAWTAIDRALERATMRGDRVLLLITGHHRPGDPPVQRGRIRAAVHDWLAASRHAPHIAAVRGAHRWHGGGGSLYLILRRRKPTAR
jgi:DNA-nicking Smr family endonuclease